MSSVEKFGDFTKKKHIKENAPAVKPVVKPGVKPSTSPTRPPRPAVMPRPKASGPAVKPIVKPDIKPATSPTRPPRPAVMPRPKASGPAVKPVVKPGIKPATSPTRPPRPAIMPRPKAMARAMSKLLLRFNYLVRSGAGAMQESIDGKGIPKDALDKIKSTFPQGGEHVVMASGITAHGIEQKISAMESSMDKEELKAAALEIVSRQFPENGIGMRFSDLKWDLELISESEADRYKMGTNNITRKSKSISIYPDKTKDAIYKKRVMNMMTQGAALKATEYFFDPKAEEVVDKLAPGLVQAYMSFQKNTQRANQAMPEGQELENMLKSNPHRKFTGIMSIEIEGEDYVIKVRAVNMFFLVHEMTKGVYEMMSLHGMQYDPKTAQAMIDESDTLFDEMYGFKYGAGLVSLFDEFYERIENELIRSADIHEHNPSLKPALLALMYNQNELNDKQFLNMMQLIFKGKPDENTVRKAKELYMREFESSKQRMEDDERWAREQDLTNSTNVDDVDLSDLMGGINSPRNNRQVDPQPEDDDVLDFDDYDQQPAGAIEDESELNMDDILDKISASGFNSLTPREKAYLDAHNEAKQVKTFSTFINEAKALKSAKAERTERRIAFLERKLRRPKLSLNERSLTEAELIQLKRRK